MKSLQTNRRTDDTPCHKPIGPFRPDELIKRCNTGQVDILQGAILGKEVVMRGNTGQGGIL